MNPEQTKLNIGCGYIKMTDFWNIDKNPNCNPDQIVDVTHAPWPYQDDFFEKIVATNVMQFLGQTPQEFESVMKEMYRVSQNNAEWYIKVPHHRCDLLWSDHAMIKGLTGYSFQLFDQSLNVKSIENSTGESTHGLDLAIDIEVFDVQVELLPYWQKQRQEQEVTAKQLEIKIGTLSNVVQSIGVYCRVHKPGRFSNYITKQKSVSPVSTD
jgi:hypothetical protein